MSPLSFFHCRCAKGFIELRWWLKAERPEGWKNSPIFENVAKTVAKIMKLKLKVEKGYFQLLLNVEISRTNLVLKMVITIKNVQVKSGQITKFCPIWSHWLKGCFAAQSARFSPWPTAARPPTSSARWSSGRLDFVYDGITSKWKSDRIFGVFGWNFRRYFFGKMPSVYLSAINSTDNC